MQGIDYSKENMDQMRKEFTVRLVNNQVNNSEMNEERTMVMDDEDFIQETEPAIVKYNEFPIAQNTTLIPTDGILIFNDSELLSYFITYSFRSNRSNSCKERSPQTIRSDFI